MDLSNRVFHTSVGAVTRRTDLDEQFDDGLDDVESFPVDPDQRSHVPHVEVPLLIDQLVEDAS